MHKCQSIMEEDANNLINKISYQNFFCNKKILVTGASGLIGLNILVFLDKLIKFGINIEVHAIINTAPLSFLNYFQFSKNIIFKIGNLVEGTDFINNNDFDIIIHAASYGQPGKFLENKIETMKLNSSVLFELYKKLNNNGKFLFISSSEVYSGNNDVPYSEEQIGATNTSHPRACYIEGKRFGETVTNIKRGEGVLSYSARLSLSYGPGSRINDRRVLNEFIKKGILEKKISIQDQGESLRTYCYVTDAIDILFRILEKGKNCLYNVGGQSVTSIKNLAFLISKKMNVPVIFPNDNNYLKDAPINVSLNLDLAKDELGKTAFINLDEGLDRTIEWQKIIYQL